jgi:site-specific DNA recombinase
MGCTRRWDGPRLPPNGYCGRYCCRCFIRCAARAPAQLQKQVIGAKKLAGRLSSLPSDDLRDLLSCFLRRVVIGEDQIQLMIGRKELLELLLNDGRIASNISNGQNPSDRRDLRCLSIELKLRRSGGVVHLVVPPNAGNVSERHSNPALIKAVARAHIWYEKVIQGKALDMRSLARQAGLTERYVGKVFACAFLAPDIIESILEGRQPHDLTFEKLCRHVPLSWDEQRSQFGFPQNSRTPSVPVFFGYGQSIAEAKR